MDAETDTSPTRTWHKAGIMTEKQQLRLKVVCEIDFGRQNQNKTMHVNPVFGYKKQKVMFVTNAPGTSLAA